jgi:hypothetical protein
MTRHPEEIPQAGHPQWTLVWGSRKLRNGGFNWPAGANEPREALAYAAFLDLRIRLKYPSGSSAANMSIR